MIEIKTDWTNKNTHIFLDGVEILHVTGFKITVEVGHLPSLEITKWKDKDGRIYVEYPASDEAFIPSEVLTFSDFRITQI